MIFLGEAIVRIELLENNLYAWLEFLKGDRTEEIITLVSESSSSQR